MTTRSPSLLRSALSFLTVRLVLQQAGLALLVFALYAMWLRVPDASALDVIGSIALAVVLLAVAGVGEATLTMHIAGAARTPRKIVRGAFAAIAGMAVWLAWIALLDHLRTNDSLLAGYLNSRFPHSLRNIFSFAHLVLWLGWTWTALAWIGTAKIAMFTVALSVSPRPVRAMFYVLRSVICWVAVVLGLYATTAITGALMAWTPGHGLRMETISLALRLGAAMLADAAVACLLLAMLAARALQADGRYAAEAGAPEASQPRTADMP